MRNEISSPSKYFDLRLLTSGIYAVLGEVAGTADCNSGLIDLGGQILVFDTFLSPMAAQDLRKISEELFGHTPHIVINSHYHNDHIWGNQVFYADTLIMSSSRTRELITTVGMEEFQWYSAHADERLQALRSEYESTRDEVKRNQLTIWLSYYASLVDALPILSVRMPNITFTKLLELHGTKHTARLVTFEGGHTESDTVLYLAQEGILFMGDLLFVDCHPYLGDGDPIQLLKALKELGQLDVACYIPGHGPVGTKKDLHLMIGYVEHCLDTAQQLVDRGTINEDVIAALEIEDQYKTWLMPSFFYTNISFLCQRLANKG